MNNLFNLQGKVAVITGGNGGIGKGIARGLAAMGSDIVIAARNPAKTEEAVREIKDAYSVGVLGLGVDVRQESDITAMIDQSLETFGKIDILVNNAGILIPRLLVDPKGKEELTEEIWDKVSAINQKGFFLCAQAVFFTSSCQGLGLCFKSTGELCYLNL